MSHRFFAAVVVPAGLFAATAAAQTPAPQPPIAQPQPGQAVPAANQTDDALIGNCLAISARTCEQISEIAQEKVVSQAVKTQLKDAAARAKKLTARLNELGYRGQAGAQPAAGAPGTATVAAALPPGADRAIALENEVAEQCVASFRSHAGQKSGANFDKAVVGMQLAAHHMAKDKLTVFQKHTTGALRQIVDEELTACEKDMKDLKAMMEKIENNDGNRKTDKSDAR